MDLQNIYQAIVEKTNPRYY